MTYIVQVPKFPRLRFIVLSIDYVRITNCFYDYDYEIDLIETKSICLYFPCITWTCLFFCVVQDGSTMLIEAAKGGHANVVNLLLDWSVNTANSQTSNSPVETSQTSPSQLYPLDFEQVSTSY